VASRRVDETATDVRRRKRSNEPVVTQSRTLVILSTPRSGTHLLAHELAATGQVGLAEEFLHDQLLAEFGDRFTVDHSDLSAYIQAFHSQTAAPNGLASIVVFPDHVNKLAAAGAIGTTGPAGFAELLELLPNPTVVLLERQSLVSQAVSFNRATQSWVWTRTKGQDAPPHPSYDFESLTAHLLRLVTIREWTLNAADLVSNRLALRTTYESLVSDPRAVVGEIGSALGLQLSGSGGAQSERPVRAADGESGQRVDALLGDIASLTKSLRWSPDSDAADTVAGSIATVADRQLAALAESVESHRASAFRRRPIVEPSADGGQLLHVRSALAPRSAADVVAVTALVGGLDNWVLQRMYASANAAFEFSPVHAWADLAGATDLVHINSHTLGWGHVGFEAKRALVAQASATVRALAERQIPIVWSINEPITPGTKHVALESEFRAELAAQAAVIHASNQAVLDRASELFAVDPQRVIVGELPHGPQTAGGVPIRDAEDDSMLLLVAGSLGQYPELGRLHNLIAELTAQLDRSCTLLVAGSVDGAGPVAHELRALEDAGAVVVEMEVDPATHASLVAQSDVVLAPCSPHAYFVPIQQLGVEQGTPVAMTTCPGQTSGWGVDWSDVVSTTATIVEAATQNSPASTSARQVTFDELVAAVKL